MKVLKDLEDLSTGDFILLWFFIITFKVFWVLSWPFRKFFPFIPHGPGNSHRRNAS